MKKLFSLLIIVVIAMAGAVSASADKYTRDASVLPPAAIVTLDKYFKSKVSLVKTDTSYGRVREYEVILKDGTEVSFDRSGNLKEIETSKSSKVPDALVPRTILDFVKSHQNKARVIGMEIDRKGYDITLSNGVEVEFDSNGNFIKYDH